MMSIRSLKRSGQWGNRVAAALGLTAALAQQAKAAPPEIRTSPANRVPACVTPERLMQFTAMRNPMLAPRFRMIAYAYQRHGEMWRVRWDYAFYQMLVETNFLSFRRGDGHKGDVHPAQNNFAGLGATGGIPGDAFPNVSTGVLAQIQHLVVYSGEPLRDPVAPRTQLKMHEILMRSRALGRPVTFADLTRRWAVDPNYARSIETIAHNYRETFCGRHDEQRRAPQFEAPPVTSVKPPIDEADERRIVRQPLQKRTVTPRSTAAVTQPAVKAPETKERSEPPSVMAPVPKTDPAPPASEKTSALPEKKSEPVPNAPEAIIAPMTPVAPKADPGCKVFTASYGGNTAVLIASTKDGLTTYTVLEVVQEKREAQIKAYVDLHAKGGQVLGEFKKRDEALAMAFALCPKE